MAGIAQRHARAGVVAAGMRALAMLLLLMCSGLACAADATLSGRALGDALRHGGYVLYFRHTATDFGQNDDNMTSFDDCTQQRNLTEKGRADARAVGEHIRRLAIPIGEVLASPYCRTRETAQLMFGRATVASDVRGGPARTDDAQRYAGLRALLAAPVSGSVDRIIVSHGNPFRAVAGTAYLGEGEAAVIEPRGAQGFRIVARIPVDGWAALAP